MQIQQASTKPTHGWTQMRNYQISTKGDTQRENLILRGTKKKDSTTISWGDFKKELFR